MSTRTTPDPQAPAPPRDEGAEDRILLRGVDRALFDRIVAARGDSSVPRLTWIDGELEAVIMKAVARSPEDRYQSVDGLRADVQNYLDGAPVSAKGGGTWYVLRKTVGRLWRPSSRRDEGPGGSPAGGPC